MTRYSVYWGEEGSRQGEEFYSLREAKKCLKSHLNDVNPKGYKTKIFSNGDFEPCGEIILTGNNKTFIANSRMTKPNY